jgi:hypothetical protein
MYLHNCLLSRFLNCFRNMVCNFIRRDGRSIYCYHYFVVHFVLVDNLNLFFIECNDHLSKDVNANAKIIFFIFLLFSDRLSNSRCYWPKQVLNEVVLRQKNTLKKSVFNWLIQFVFDIVFTIQVFIKIINLMGFGLAYLQ